jgi:protein TonB
MKLHETSDLLVYGKDENNIYYRTEERARFKDGKEALYRDIRGNLTYPEAAEDAGVEGVVQLKFVVDRWGNIDKVETMENIDAADWIVEEMVAEAKKAFKSVNHDWIPGEINNIEVPQWVIIPIHFKMSLPPSLQRL